MLLVVLSNGLKAWTSVPGPSEVPKSPRDLAQTCSLVQPFPLLYSWGPSTETPEYINITLQLMICFAEYILLLPLY